MSIQAVAWALDQDFTSYTPKGRLSSALAAKLVLISLSNHADHVSGHCWPSASTIAKESSCSVRSVYRLISALQRNGYIEIKRVKGGNGKQRTNNYWILFDRKPGPWQYYSPNEDDPGPPDVEGYDTESYVDNDAEGTQTAPEHDSKAPSESYDSAPESCGPGDNGVTRHIMPEPSILEPSESVVGQEQPKPEPEAPNPKPQSLVQAIPQGFDPNERAQALDRLKASEEARKKSQPPVFVWEGTDHWMAWKAHKEKLLKRPFDLITTFKCPDGKMRRGWWFPTLRPPPSNPDPTAGTLMNATDFEELAKGK